jgi:phosphohistidine phosphatase
MATLTTHLYIIRHAWAEDDGPDGTDESRRLTKKGRKRFADLVDRLRKSGMEIDLVATSPLVRTRETAEILAAAFDPKPRIEPLDALAPGADWPSLVEWTAHQDAASVAWVGHMPCVARLVALTIGDGTASIRMQKGAVASIRLDDGPGQPGELEWLLNDDVA